ncbi:hypothetical protein ABZW10_24350 [Kitasatospora sp. NPDC004723]
MDETTRGPGATGEGPDTVLRVHPGVALALRAGGGPAGPTGPAGT